MGDKVVTRGGAERFEGRGLVPIVNPTYGAPGGEYSLVTIVHEDGCLRGAFDDDIRTALASTCPTTFHQVEAVVRALLFSGGCPTTWFFDRNSTLGLFARFHSPSSTSSAGFVPSQAYCMTADTQMTRLESSYVASELASDVFTFISGAMGNSDGTAPGNPVQWNSSVVLDVPASQGDWSARGRVEKLSPGERKLYRNVEMDRSSDGDYIPSGDRANELSSPLAVGGGSGFNSQGLDGKLVRPALPVLKPHMEFVAHTREQRGNWPLTGKDDVLTTSQGVSSQALIVRDTPMDIGEGKNSEGTGLGDSRQAVLAAASPAADESQEAQHVPSVIVLPSSPIDASSPPLVSLPATAQSLSQATVGMLEGLEDIEMGRAVPADGISSSSSDDGSVDSEIYVMFGGKDGYASLKEVAEDMGYVAVVQEEGRKTTRILMKEVARLASLVAGMDEELATLKQGCGCAAKRIRADMARVMNPDRPDEAANAVVDEVEEMIGDEGKKKKDRPSQRRRKAAAKRAAAAAAATAATAVAEAEEAGNGADRVAENGKKVEVGSAALYLTIASKAPPPQVNRQTRPRTMTPMVPVLLAPVMNPGERRSPPTIPELIPTPNSRERHVTMRFAAGKKTQLPITPEAIRVRLNQSLSNQGKVARTTSYFKEARARLRLGVFS